MQHSQIAQSRGEMPTGQNHLSTIRALASVNSSYRRQKLNSVGFSHQIVMGKSRKPTFT
jgi:hypothetical protein